jgi:DNA-binding response OmpR family regulator
MPVRVGKRSQSVKSQRAIHFHWNGKINMAFSDRDRKRILLVEDQEDDWEMLAYSLWEYRLICARDFNEGLRLARGRYFDFYILDNWLPDGNGVELCRLIREFDPHTPILFYSAVGYAHNIQEGLNAGAQGYLVKPVSSGELRQAVTQLISAAGEREFEARRAEVAAILEELTIRRMENAERIDKAKEKHQRSEKKAIRLKAEMAFLSAGGTRGDFARLWPSVFIEGALRHPVR